MSVQHPIIAVTGSPGSGTTTVRRAFEVIFRRQGLKAQFVEGAGFHRYTAEESRAVIAESIRMGKRVTRFGPEGNLFYELESLFAAYSENGRGRLRYYIHDEHDAARHGGSPGAFTEWQDVEPGTDLMLYEGMHGGVAARTWGRRRVHAPNWLPQWERRSSGRKGVDVAGHVDLLIGIVPGINLEWIQKIHRDCGRASFRPEDVVDTILRRLPDYIDYIAPQFTISDINMQRMPLVDTSNPFTARDVPTADESFVVIHFRHPKKFDFTKLLKQIAGSRMTRSNTMIAPGGKMLLALEVICGPLIAEMMDKRRATAERGIKDMAS
jgi:phosphoribulokinase